MKFNKTKNYSHLLIPLILSLLLNCGETHYILKEDTPPISEGFFGFRWTTPMSTVETEFQKQPGVNVVSELNRANTSCFSGANFLGYAISLSKFTFDGKGLNTVKLVIKLDSSKIEDVFYSLKENLTNIYGGVTSTFGIRKHNEPPDYLEYFSWTERRLELKLMPHNTVEINAYRDSPHFKAITNN